MKYEIEQEHIIFIQKVIKVMHSREVYATFVNEEGEEVIYLAEEIIEFVLKGQMTVEKGYYVLGLLK